MNGAVAKGQKGDTHEVAPEVVKATQETWVVWARRAAELAGDLDEMAGGGTVRGPRTERQSRGEDEAPRGIACLEGPLPGR